MLDVETVSLISLIIHNTPAGQFHFRILSTLATCIDQLYLHTLFLEVNINHRFRVSLGNNLLLQFS